MFHPVDALRLQVIITCSEDEIETLADSHALSVARVYTTEKLSGVVFSAWRGGPC